MNNNVKHRLRIEKEKTGTSRIVKLNYNTLIEEEEATGIQTVDLMEYLKEYENETGKLIEQQIADGEIVFDDKEKQKTIINHFDLYHKYGQPEEKIEKIYITKKNNKYTFEDENHKILEEDLDSIYPAIYLYQQQMGRNNYSINKLIEMNEIEIIDEDKKTETETISKIIVFAEEENKIKINYEDGQTEIKPISEFSTLIDTLAKQKNILNEEDYLEKLIESNYVGIRINPEKGNYDRKIHHVKLSPNGEMVVVSNFKRKKLNIEENPDEVFSILSALSDQNERTGVKNLMKKNKLKITSEKNKEKIMEKNNENLPVQIVFGKYLDKDQNICYKYYAFFDQNDYEEITKAEAVEYFNKLAAKNKIKESNPEKMFEKEICKTLPLSEVEEYMKNPPRKKGVISKIKDFFTEYDEEEEIEENAKKQEKTGFFTKLKNFAKKPIVVLAAFTTAVVLACTGIIGKLVSKINEKYKEPTKSSDGILPGQSAIEDNNQDNINNNVEIKNNQFNKLLNECAGNVNRQNAMEKIGLYSEKYNNHEIVKENSKELSHSFDELLAQYLIYNDINSTTFSNIIGKYNLNPTEFSKNLKNSIEEDAKIHLKQTNSINKDIIIESQAGKAFYKKYENLFITMNSSSNKDDKLMCATKFYNDVREDLPGMENNDYTNVKNYMYIIEEFRIAMESSDIDVSNKFTEQESKYIQNILDQKIMPELTKNIAASQAEAYVDSYYGNETLDLYPSLDEFKNTLESDTNLIEPSKPQNIVIPNQSTNSNTNTGTNINIIPPKEDTNISNNTSTDYIENNTTPPINDTIIEIEDNINSGDVIEDTTTEVEDNIISDNTSSETVTENIECEIIDNINPSVVEDTLNRDDMEFYDDDNSIENTEEKETIIIPEVSVDDQYYNNDTNNSIEIEDYYENIGETPEYGIIYDQNAPLPDPNEVSTAATTVSNEAIADYIVESMANDSNTYNSDVAVKVYHL